MYGICFAPMFISGQGAMYDTGELRIKKIYGNNKERGQIQIPVDFTMLNKTSKIELSVASDFNCRK